MQSRITAAVALGFALAQLAIAPAYADQTAAAFRTAPAQTFTAQDLQRYGMTADAAERAIAYQDKGYEVRVLSEEEAAQYQAGITDNQWLMLGILAGVIVIAVAVSD